MRKTTDAHRGVSRIETDRSGCPRLSRLWPLLCGLILLFLGGGWGSRPAGAQENLPALIKKIQPAVVTVVGYNAKGKAIRLGSGFFVNGQGHLITCMDVVSKIVRADVKLPHGGLYPITTVLAADKKADLVKLAVTIPGGTPHYLQVSSNRPVVGEHVLTVGSPLGLEQSVSEGLLSAIRNIRGRGEFLQISAPISPGSSGGPVVNLKGEVIGVATFQVRGQNINFAAPGNRVLALADGPPRPFGRRNGTKSLPPRPGVRVPPPQMRVP